MKKKTEQAAPTRKVQIAQLDADGIYQGVTEINETDLTAEHVQLKHGCDLPLGEHRWDKHKRTFVSIREVVPGNAAPDAQSVNALAIGMISLHAQGLTLPPETLARLDSYTSSMDFMGPLSQSTLQMVQAFKARSAK